MHRAARPPASPVRRRARLHGLLRLAPGRDQEGHGGARSASGEPVWEVPVPADRPDRRRPHVRGDHPRQQPVGQGRRRVRDASTTTSSTSRAACRSSSRRSVQRIVDAEGGELTAARDLGRRSSASTSTRGPLALDGYRVARATSAGDVDQIEATVMLAGVEHVVEGTGNGPIAAFVTALARRPRRSRLACATTTSTRSARARTRRQPPTWRSSSHDEVTLGRRHPPEHRDRVAARRGLGSQPGRAGRRVAHARDGSGGVKV